MALYAVYYQTGVSPLDGEPLCTVCLITQSESAAVAKEQELKEKTDRLNVLNGLLNVDKRDNELADDAPDEGEELPERSPKELER